MRTFLEITLNKIIISVLLFVFTVPFLQVENAIRCFRAPCGATPNQTFFTGFILGHQTVMGINFLFFISGLVIAYLLASLIIFVFQRFRKRENS